MSFLCSVRYDNSELIFGERGLTELFKKEYNRITFNNFEEQFKNTKQTSKILVIEPKSKLDEKNKKVEKMFWFGEYLILASKKSPNFWAHLETHDSWKEYFSIKAEVLEFKNFEAGNY